MNAQCSIYPHRVRKKNVVQFHDGPHNSICEIGIEKARFGIEKLSLASERPDLASEKPNLARYGDLARFGPGLMARGPRPMAQGSKWGKTHFVQKFRKLRNSESIFGEPKS